MPRRPSQGNTNSNTSDNNTTNNNILSGVCTFIYYPGATSLGQGCVRGAVFLTTLGRGLLSSGASVPFCSALPGLGGRGGPGGCGRANGGLGRWPGCPGGCGSRDAVPVRAGGVRLSPPCFPGGSVALFSSSRRSGTEEPPWAAGTGGGISATSQKAPAVVNTAHGAAGKPVKVTSLCAHAARPIWAPRLLSWGWCGGCRCLSLPEPRSRCWLCSAVFPGCVQGSPLARERARAASHPALPPPAPGRGGSWVASDLAIRAGNAGSAVRFDSSAVAVPSRIQG